MGRVLIFILGDHRRTNVPEQKFERRELSLVVIWKKSVHWFNLRLLPSIHCPLLSLLIEPLTFYLSTWPLKIKIRVYSFP